jgi:hypothetical protein
MTNNLLFLSSLVTMAFLIWKKYKWSTWLGLYYAFVYFFSHIILINLVRCFYPLTIFVLLSCENQNPLPISLHFVSPQLIPSILSLLCLVSFILLLPSLQSNIATRKVVMVNIQLNVLVLELGFSIGGTTGV